MKKKIQWAYVGNTVKEVDSKKVRKILIADLGDKFKFRYICVDSGEEDTFLKGDGGVDYVGWKYAEIIKEAEYIPFEEGNIEDAKKLVGNVLIHKKDSSLYAPYGLWIQRELDNLFKNYTFEDGSPVGKLREE